MTFKIYSQALEKETKKIVKTFPKSFLKELENYAERNSLYIGSYSVNDKKPLHACCPMCLKAHAIKKAKELKLRKPKIEFINSLLDCEQGHNGYYMDKDKLIKI